MTFRNECCQLWSYWTEFQEIFTRYRGIIYAVNALIAVVISHSVWEWQSDKYRGGGNFAPFLPLNWLPWQRPLRYRKRRSDWSSAIQYLPYGAKIVKISPADPEILWLRANKSATTQNSLPWQRPLMNWKKWTGLTTFTQIPSIWWKDRENRSIRFWDRFAQFKKKERKKLTQVKYIARSAGLPSGLKKYVHGVANPWIEDGWRTGQNSNRP